MAELARFVLGLDLDGTCADFYGRMREIAAEWTGRPSEELNADPDSGLRSRGRVDGGADDSRGVLRVAGRAEARAATRRRARALVVRGGAGRAHPLGTRRWLGQPVRSRPEQMP